MHHNFRIRRASRYCVCVCGCVGGQGQNRARSCDGWQRPCFTPFLPQKPGPQHIGAQEHFCVHPCASNRSADPSRLPHSPYLFLQVAFEGTLRTCLFASLSASMVCKGCDIAGSEDIETSPDFRTFHPQNWLLRNCRRWKWCANKATLAGRPQAPSMDVLGYCKVSYRRALR